MKLLQKILAPTDLLDSSENVVDHAIGLARIFESEVVLMHILAESVDNDKVRQFLEEAAHRRLGELKARIEKAGVKASTPILIPGSHFEKIVTTADQLKVNMVLIGSGEKQKGEKFQLGTTAERIIRRSGRPVWVVKQGQPFGMRKILCPVDFSKESKLALKNAILLARRIKAELVVLSVFDLYNKSRTFLNTQQPEYQVNRARALHREEFEEFLKSFHLHDVNWQMEITEGDPAAEILAAVERHGADLLFMGTTGKSGLSLMMMGSVTEKVVREVPCTFMTSKTQDVMKLQIEERIRDIESHYKSAVQLMNDGYFHEAVREFKVCLKINEMHVPSLKGLAAVYRKMGDEKSAQHYDRLALEIMDRIWNLKIESEVRGLYRY